jgi:hypothetical protein
MLRLGMANLIARWRRLVDDVNGEVWTDEEAQAILDGNRHHLLMANMPPVGRYVNQAWSYKLYVSPYGNLEEAGSGDDYWRIYNAMGVTCDPLTYTVDYVAGWVTFAEDQLGEARYIDGSAYDLNGTAAQGWRERMGRTSSAYTFSSGGASYSRSQWFDHCDRMAGKYEALSWTQSVDWERGDVNPNCW